MNDGLMDGATAGRGAGVVQGGNRVNQKQHLWAALLLRDRRKRGSNTPPTVLYKV